MSPDSSDANTSGACLAASASSPTFAAPSSPDANAASVAGIVRRARPKRTSRDAAPFAASVRAATQPAVERAPSPAHIGCASNTPNACTTVASRRFRHPSRATSAALSTGSDNSPNGNVANAAATSPSWANDASNDRDDTAEAASPDDHSSDPAGPAAGTSANNPANDASTPAPIRAPEALSSPSRSSNTSTRLAPTQRLRKGY